MKLKNLDCDETKKTRMVTKLNKPAAQAAGADPFRYNSTNRQNPPLQ